MNIQRFFILVLALSLGIFSACGHVSTEFPSYAVPADNASLQLQAAQEAFDRASQSKKRAEKIAISKKGMDYAAQCVNLKPKQAACYFYQALNTGLYYEARVFGYASGMVKIAQAAQQVTQLDPTFEQAGGYRILGQLYLKAPVFNIGSNEVTRDLDKSRDYLEQAVSLAPEYPENHLFLAETLAAQEEWPLVKKHLDTAQQLIATGSFTRLEKQSWTKLQGKLNDKLPHQ